MKIKVIASVLILVHLFIFMLISSSCAPKFIYLDDGDGDLIPQIEASNSEKLLSAYKKSNIEEADIESLSPLKKEIEGLRYILAPYFSINSKHFIGVENRAYIEKFLLNPEDAYISISSDDWEKTIRILFTFDNTNDASIKTHILDYTSEEKIKRQYAVAGLMNLLSLRYSIELEEDKTSLQKAGIITDLDGVEEAHQLLISNAFCLGFTDSTVESSKTFRPDEYLNRGEVISMLYRILCNLGLPAAADTLEDTEIGNVPYDNSEISSTALDEVCSVETILEEYSGYISKITKRDNSSDKIKLEMLKKAERIIDIDYIYQFNDTPFKIEKWLEILKEVFGLDTEEITEYTAFETDGTLTYDIVAITMFSSPKLFGQVSLKEAKEKEIEEARKVIPQFDTARDIDQFARMFSSGLLEGLYQSPGFTPQRPVSNTEALLLTKRIVEKLAVK